MPRRRPDRLRRTNARGPTTNITGVSRPVLCALDRLDRPEVSSQRVACDLRLWITACRLSRSRLGGEHNDWTCIIAPSARDTVERALNALPRGKSRELRAVVRPWDEMYYAKTLPRYPEQPARPWWWNRS